MTYLVLTNGVEKLVKADVPVEVLLAQLKKMGVKVESVTKFM